MKKFILIFISVLLTAATFAQNVPQAVNFSATVRDGYNNPLSNTGVTVRIAFYSGNSEIYWEEHAVTTNVNGFVSFLLNREMSDHEGSFDEIPWQSGTYTMNVQYKRTSGGEYVDLGSHELTSGFYAFTSNYALTAHTAQNLEGFAIDVAGARNGNVLVYNSETGRWEASDILSLLQAFTGLTTCTITFDANGGSGIIRPQTFTIGTAQALTANAFTKENNWFTGWNTAIDGQGTAYTDSQEITATENMTLYAQWKLSTGETNGHVWVDLGLPSGTRWATCNVGANNPEGYGDYFAWGETTTKETYYWSNYRYCNGSFSALTKYCNNAIYGNNGFTDEFTTLEATDDAATANWGSGWRMPTQTELNELKSSCTVTWVTYNGVNGRLFTGPNGNSIFLPAAGYHNGRSFYDAGSDGYYWSSSLHTDLPYRAWNLYFYSGNCDVYGYNRLFGQSVRPVCVSAQN